EDRTKYLRRGPFCDQRVEERAVLLELVEDVLPVDVGVRAVEQFDELLARLPGAEPVRIRALGDDEALVQDPALLEHARDQLVHDRQRRLGGVGDVVLERGPLALPLVDVETGLRAHALTVPRAVLSNTRRRQ